MKHFYTILSCLLFIHLAIGQQANSDRSLILSHIKSNEAAKAEANTWRPKMHLSYNPFKLIAFTPLFLYQRFISEQVSAVCEFEPSCSGFSVQSIIQLGLIKGLFLSADRLTRCNGEAQVDTKYYLIDHHSGKVIDEPFMYRFKD